VGKAVENINDTSYFENITGLVPAMHCDGPHFQVSKTTAGNLEVFAWKMTE